MWKAEYWVIGKDDTVYSWQVTCDQRIEAKVKVKAWLNRVLSIQIRGLCVMDESYYKVFTQDGSIGVLKLTKAN